MLTVGDKFPDFVLKAVVSTARDQEFQEISLGSYPGKWLVVFFWPLDFTHVCPTEIVAFGEAASLFAERDALVLGASHDSQYAHLAWRKQHEGLRSLPIPMMSDSKHELTTALGIAHKTEGVPLRATFVVDPLHVIRHVTVNDLMVGRNVEETLRVLEALLTDELCPCNWRKGEATLNRA